MLYTHNQTVYTRFPGFSEIASFYADGKIHIGCALYDPHTHGTHVYKFWQRVVAEKYPKIKEPEKIASIIAHMNAFIKENRENAEYIMVDWTTLEPGTEVIRPYDGRPENIAFKKYLKGYVIQTGTHPEDKKLLITEDKRNSKDSPFTEGNPYHHGHNKNVILLEDFNE